MNKSPYLILSNGYEVSTVLLQGSLGIEKYLLKYLFISDPILEAQRHFDLTLD